MIFNVDGKLCVIVFETYSNKPDPAWFSNWLEYTKLLSEEEENAILANYNAKVLWISAGDYKHILPRGIDPQDIFEIYEFETEQDYMFFCLRFN